MELGLPSSPPVSGNLNILQGSQEGSVIRAVTTMSGPAGYIDKYIVPELPSSWGQDVNCHLDTMRQGLMSCNWTSELVPSPGGQIDSISSSSPSSSSSSKNSKKKGSSPSSDWIRVETTRTGSSSAIISVQGMNSRNCRIKFDKPISSFVIRSLGSNSNNSKPNSSPVSGLIQPGYEIQPEGVKDLVLYSRTWGNTFHVEVNWKVTETETNGKGLDEKLEGRVGCEWVEYASASAGSSYASTSGQIPALEELLQFSPLWATVTKLTYGLVEAEGRFSV